MNHGASTIDGKNYRWNKTDDEFPAPTTDSCPDSRKPSEPIERVYELHESEKKTHIQWKGSPDQEGFIHPNCWLDIWRYGEGGAETSQTYCQNDEQGVCSCNELCADASAFQRSQKNLDGGAWSTREIETSCANFLDIIQPYRTMLMKLQKQHSWEENGEERRTWKLMRKAMKMMFIGWLLLLLLLLLLQIVAVAADCCCW